MPQNLTSEKLIGLGNGLVLTANVDLDVCRHVALLEHEELMRLPQGLIDGLV